MELGGLARTDQAGYGEEFDRLRHDLLAADPPPDAAPVVPGVPGAVRGEQSQHDDGGTG